MASRYNYSTKTKEDLGNREDYKGRILETLEKVRSPKRIDFMILKEDSDDDWFVTIVDYQKKSKVVKNTSLITMKDYPDFVERYCRMLGFHKVEE